MDWLISFEGAGTVALPIAAIGFGFSILATLYMFITHAVRVRRELLNDRLHGRWTIHLRNWLIGETEPIAKPKERELHLILPLWLKILDTFSGSVTQQMAAFAEAVGLDKFVIAHLRSPDRPTRVYCVIACGHLRRTDQLPHMLELLSSEDAMLALAAGRSAIQIAPNQALPAVLQQVRARTEWASGQISALIGNADPDLLSQQLHGPLLSAAEHELKHLLPAVAAATAETIQPSLIARMESIATPEVLSECLRHLRGPRGASVARQYLQHPVWFVRLRAIEALKIYQAAEDAPVLASLQQDSNWWVRLRARQALAGNQPL